MQKISGISKPFRSWNIADTMFLFSCKRNRIPPYIPWARAIVASAARERQEKY